ncbi:hypothetical protein DN409_16510 [Bacillus mycoides]|nr:hypothetical protein DN409_16510 [Bacillus mycoides]
MECVFASPQQIFGIAVYKNESDLEENWEKAAKEFAVNIQSQLVGNLYNLKWDMYLILVVQSNFENLELCKQIENDRMHFKKIVMAQNLEDFHRKLPIQLEIEESNQLTIFSDKQFLEELKKVVSPEAAERLDISIYEVQPVDIANDLIFLHSYKDEGEHA